MKQYEHQVAVITGASSGIGKSLALQLAKAGCNLALADRDINGLEVLKKEILGMKVDCFVQQLDVADNDAQIRFAEDVFEHYGRVDMLFNNAGVSLIDSVENQTLEDFHWLMNVNFWGVVYGTNAFLAHLKNSPCAHIVNVSSLFGLLSLPLQSAYNSSKFAVKGFTEALKMEMAGTNVQVYCVHPGGIKTNITNSAKIATKLVPKSQILSDFEKQAKTTADQAAHIILDGIKKSKRRILIGGDAKILDFISRWFPSTYEKILGFEKGVIKKRSQNT